jgi:hypothetical protein
MRISRWIALVLLLLALPLSPTKEAKAAKAAETAEYTTIKTLYRQCGGIGEHDDFDTFFCLGFISGVGDVMFLNGTDKVISANPRDLAVACEHGRRITTDDLDRLARHISIEAMVQAFKNWAAKYPEQWDAPAKFGVANAIRDTWPCP